MQEIYEKALKAIVIIVTIAFLTTMIAVSVGFITMTCSNKQWIEATYDYDYPPLITNEQTINH